MAIGDEVLFLEQNLRLLFPRFQRRPALRLDPPAQHRRKALAHRFHRALIRLDAGVIALPQPFFVPIQFREALAKEVFVGFIDALAVRVHLGHVCRRRQRRAFRLLDVME